MHSEFQYIRKDQQVPFIYHRAPVSHHHDSIPQEVYILEEILTDEQNTCIEVSTLHHLPSFHSANHTMI